MNKAGVELKHSRHGTTPGPILGVAHSRLTFQVPAGACDAHVHVFGPAQRYAFAPERDLHAAAMPRSRTSSGCIRCSASTVSSSCTRAPTAPTMPARSTPCARSGGGRAAWPSSTPRMGHRELRAMHKAGVRGVRVNLATAGVADPQVAWPLLQATSQRVASFGWHVQINTGLPVIAALHDRLLTLPAPSSSTISAAARAEAGAPRTGLRPCCRWSARQDLRQALRRIPHLQAARLVGCGAAGPRA